MAIKSGFFNSINGDRLYDAMDMNNFFEGFVTEGVLSTFADALDVTAGSGMSVIVGTGKAWFLNTWLYNTSAHQLSLSPAHSTLTRYDIAVMQFDLSSRANTLMIVEGAPSVSPYVPVLINTGSVKQVPLSVITVSGGITQITSGMLEDQRGTTECPICTGLLQQMTLGDMYNAWYLEFQAWMAIVEDDLDDINSGLVFSELDTIRGLERRYKNMLVNGSFAVRESQYNSRSAWSAAEAAVSIYPGVCANWGVEVVNGGAWDINRVSVNERDGIELTCVTAKTPLGADTKVLLTQFIEGYLFDQSHWGAGADAQPLALSFTARSNYSANRIVVELLNLDYNYAFQTEFEIDTVDLDQRVSIQIPALAMSHVWTANSASMQVNIWLAAGTNYTSSGTWPSGEWYTPITANRRAVSQQNMAGATGRYLQIRDMQLEVGSVPTLFNRLPFRAESEDARRYVEFFSVWRGLGVGISTSTMLVNIPFQVEKRTTPTITWTSGGVDDTAITFTGAPVVSDYYTSTYSKTKQAMLLFNTSVAVSPGHTYAVTLNNLLINARLTSGFYSP